MYEKICRSTSIVLNTYLYLVKFETAQQNDILSKSLILQFTRVRAEQFYQAHAKMPYFETLIRFMIRCFCMHFFSFLCPPSEIRKSYFMGFVRLKKCLIVFHTSNNLFHFDCTLHICFICLVYGSRSVHVMVLVRDNCCRAFRALLGPKDSNRARREAPQT